MELKQRLSRPKRARANKAEMLVVSYLLPFAIFSNLICLSPSPGRAELSLSPVRDINESAFVRMRCADL